MLYYDKSMITNKNALHLEISIAMHQIVQSGTAHQQHGQYYV